jgi:hypothetical protein
MGVAAIPYALIIGGALIKGQSQLQQGQAASYAASYNQQTAQLQADDAIARGVEDERRFRVGVSQLIGQQRAGFSGQGVDINSGTPLAVQQDAARQGELDALTIRNDAFREALGYKIQAENFSMQSKAADKQGKAGFLGTILGGLGDLF